MTVTKKILSVILAMLMLCSASLTAYADVFDDLGKTLDGVSQSLDFRRTDCTNAVAKLSKTSYVYNGKIRKPSVTVTLNGTELEKGIDYKVTYSGDCKSVGTHKVTVTFVGNMEGDDKVLTFTIKPAKMPASTSVSKLTAKKGAIVVKYKKVTKNNKGYLIQVATDKKFKKNVKVVEVNKPSTVSKTVKKLKSGKKYYVRVCSFTKVNGVKVCTKWSKAKTVKTK